jgi:uncharacterized protein (DUF1810 family)
VNDGLGRFVSAQDGMYEAALAEISAGDKRTHWMWFVFPQIAGLGTSTTAQRYAIASLDEARAYLAHPVLGPRLLECATALVEGDETDEERIFGPVDAMKLRSSMTLFTHAAPAELAFRAVLGRFYGGVEDDATLARLS